MSKTLVKLTDYNDFMSKQLAKFKNHIQQIAKNEDVQIHYVNSSKISKEQVAKKDLAKHPNKLGLISIVSCLGI